MAKEVKVNIAQTIRNVSTIKINAEQIIRNCKAGFGNISGIIRPYWGELYIENISAEVMWINGGEVIYDEAGNYSIGNIVSIIPGHNQDTYADEFIIKKNSVLTKTSKGRKGLTYVILFYIEPSHTLIDISLKNSASDFNLCFGSLVEGNNCAINSNYLGSGHISYEAGYVEQIVTPANIADQYSYGGIFKLTEDSDMVLHETQIKNFIINGKTYQPEITTVPWGFSIQE